MTTVRDAVNQIRSLLNQLYIDGYLQPEAELAGLIGNSINQLNMAAREILVQSKYTKDQVVSTSKLTNLFQGSNVINFNGDAVEFAQFNVGTPKRYAFEASKDAECTVTIYESINNVWVGVETVNVTTASQLYTGQINLSDPANKYKVVITGTYACTISNMSLYDVAYNPARIPIYGPYVPLQLPDDFEQLVNIYNTDFGVDVRFNDFRTTSTGTILVPSQYSLNLRIVYVPKLDTLINLTDTIPLPQKYIDAMCYYVAGNIAPFEKDTLTNQFLIKYENLKRGLITRTPAQEEPIADSMSFMSQWG